MVSQPVSSGRTLLVYTNQLSEPIRKAVDHISKSLRLDKLKAIPAQYLSHDACGSVITDIIDGNVAAWHLVVQWIMGNLLGDLDNRADLNDAERWFWGDDTALTYFSRSLETPELRSAFSLLSSIQVHECSELLPYILDPLGLGTRRAVIRDSSQQQVRRFKKEWGVFYTPPDVAQYMVGRIVDGVMDEVWLNRSGTIIDPACGTGVFLKEAFATLVDKKGLLPLDALQSIYGIDINRLTADLCAYVLAYEYLRRSHDDRRALRPGIVWQLARMNIASTDSIALAMDHHQISWSWEATQRSTEDRFDQRATMRRCLLQGAAYSWNPGENSCRWANIWDVFPEVQMQGGFQAMVTNPPYAPLGRRDDVEYLSKVYSTLRAGRGRSGINLWVPFVELVWHLTPHPPKAAAWVLPLAVAYSTHSDVVELRRVITKDTSGWWSFAFFDRTPDSLFGDDIKQRAAIVFRFEASRNQVTVTRLIRWTSRTRHRLFQQIKTVDLTSGIDIVREGIPKLDDEVQLSVFSAVLSNLRAACTAMTPLLFSEPDSLYVGQTAYNWLVVYRDLEFTTHRYDASPTGEPLKRIVLRSATEADACFAVLCSRFSYWLWRVVGDGFHVTQDLVSRVIRLLRTFNSAELNDLAVKGRQLWQEMKRNPVFSVNSGKKTVSFNPHLADEVLRSIDETTLRSLRLPMEFAEFLRRYTYDTMVVEREECASI